MNRRSIIKAIPLTIVTSAFHSYGSYSTWQSKDTTESEEAFEEVQEISTGVYFIKGKTSFFENGDVTEVQCNNGWIIFEDFVLVIDANFPGNAPDLLREIQKTTSKPIRFVFNTHHHGDHIYGNRFWAEQGAIVIAYSGLVEELKKYETGYYSNTPGRWEDMAQKRSDLKESLLLPPLATFNPAFIIEDKNRRVELLHVGAGHTLGDAVAWLPKEKIMYVGDACLNGPYNLFRDAHISSWINTLDTMKRYQPKIIVPGHGNLGDANTISRQQQYFKHLYHWVEQQKAKGDSWKSIQANLQRLREMIERDKLATFYLIPEPAVISGFSLESHVKKIFEEAI